MVQLVCLCGYCVGVQIVGFNCKLSESEPADRQCGFRRILLSSTVIVTFAVIEKAISTRKAYKRCCTHFDEIEA